MRVRSLGASLWLNITQEEYKMIMVVREYIRRMGKHMDVPIEHFESWCGGARLSQHRMGKLSNNKIIFSEFSNERSICYGTPDLEFTGPADFCMKRLYADTTPRKFIERHFEGGKHYVYTCKLDGLVDYVGKGVGTRIQHLRLTKGHNRALTSAIKNCNDVKIEKIAEFLTDEMATDLEEAYIRSHLLSGKDLYNVNMPKWLREEVNKFKEEQEQ
jgi:hypothetical protein